MISDEEEIVSVVDGVKISAKINPHGLELLVNDRSIGAVDFFQGKLQLIIDDQDSDDNTRLIPLRLPGSSSLVLGGESG